MTDVNKTNIVVDKLSSKLLQINDDLLSKADSTTIQSTLGMLIDRDMANLQNEIDRLMVLHTIVSERTLGALELDLILSALVDGGK